MSKITAILTASLLTLFAASAYADITINFVNNTDVGFKTGSIPEVGIITQFSDAHTTTPFTIPTATIAPVLKKHPNLQITYLLTQPSIQYFPCSNPAMSDGGNYTATLSGTQGSYKCQWAVN